MDEKNKYPIRVVSNKTGLSTHVIRAWEKRYGAVEPDRTDSNRRLYSDREVNRLQLLSKLTSLGYNIGQIATLSDDELSDLLPEPEETRKESDVKSEGQSKTEAPKVSQEVTDILDKSLSAIKQLDQRELERILMRASTMLSQPELIDEVISPLIYKSGELWADGEFRTTHEHFATAVLRSFLGNLRNSFEVPDSAPGIIITTPAGQVHELGALIVATTSSALGWQAIYLGPNLPAEEIAAAVEMKSCNVVSLSLIYPPGDRGMTEELRKLYRLLPSSVEIVAGGRAVHTYDEVLDEINARVMEDLSEFRTYLQQKAV